MVLAASLTVLGAAAAAGAGATTAGAAAGAAAVGVTGVLLQAPKNRAVVKLAINATRLKLFIRFSIRYETDPVQSRQNCAKVTAIVNYPWQIYLQTGRFLYMRIFLVITLRISGRVECFLRCFLPMGCGRSCKMVARGRGVSHVFFQTIKDSSN